MLSNGQYCSFGIKYYVLLKNVGLKVANFDLTDQMQDADYQVKLQQTREIQVLDNRHLR